jgi:hypothetical protein
MLSNYVSVSEGEQLTGLPARILVALAENGEMPFEYRGADLYIAKSALLGWCRLYGRILEAVSAQHAREGTGMNLSARNLVWMSQSGLLAGRERVGS